MTTGCILSTHLEEKQAREDSQEIREDSARGLVLSDLLTFARLVASTSSSYFSALRMGKSSMPPWSIRNVD